MRESKAIFYIILGLLFWASVTNEFQSRRKTGYLHEVLHSWIKTEGIITGRAELPGRSDSSYKPELNYIYNGRTLSAKAKCYQFNSTSWSVVMTPRDKRPGMRVDGHSHPYKGQTVTVYINPNNLFHVEIDPDAQIIYIKDQKEMTRLWFWISAPGLVILLSWRFIEKRQRKQALFRGQSHSQGTSEK
jgi:hypothetical protein